MRQMHYQRRPSKIMSPKSLRREFFFLDLRGVVSVENHVSIQLPRLEVPVYVRSPISLSLA